MTVAIRAQADPSDYSLSILSLPAGEQRSIRLGQVAEAAAAVVARVGADRASLPVTADGSALQQLRQSRVSSPDFAVEETFVLKRPSDPSSRRKRRVWLILSNGVIMGTLLIVGLLLNAKWSSPTGSGREWQASNRNGEFAFSSSQSSERPSLPRMGGENLQLVGHASRGVGGQPVPLGLTVRGQADGAMVTITGLVAGMTLSTGNALGANGWQVPATQAVLGNTWIIPPGEFIGTVELVAELHLADARIAHRVLIHPQWVAPWTVVAAQPVEMPLPPAALPPQPATALPPHAVTALPPPQPVVAQRLIGREEAAILVKRGKEFMANGDLAGARVVLRRAAEAKDAEAALVLAATYDPTVLRNLKVYGIAADVVMARTWYEKAKGLGSAEAPRRLEILAGGTR